MKKKLMRSRDHKVISGVMGGLAEYLSTDPALLRIVIVLFVLATGVFPGIIAYIVAAFVIPETPTVTHSVPVEDDDTAI